MDNCCIFVTSKEKTNEFVESLKIPKDKKSKSAYQHKYSGFDYAFERSTEHFLWVDVSQAEDMIMLRKPHLMERIVVTVLFQEKQACFKHVLSAGFLFKDEDG